MHIHSVITVEKAIRSAYRLALVYSGVDPLHVYPSERWYQPEQDENYLLEIIEGARDAWRPILGSRSKRPVEPRP